MNLRHLWLFVVFPAMCAYEGQVSSVYTRLFLFLLVTFQAWITGVNDGVAYLDRWRARVS